MINGIIVVGESFRLRCLRKTLEFKNLGENCAGLTWGILMALPIIVMIIITIIDEVSLIDELFFLVPFVALVAVNGILDHNLEYLWYFLSGF